jgi:hypothetical protein
LEVLFTRAVPFVGSGSVRAARRKEIVDETTRAVDTGGGRNDAGIRRLFFGFEAPLPGGAPVCSEAVQVRLVDDSV